MLDFQKVLLQIEAVRGDSISEHFPMDLIRQEAAAAYASGAADSRSLQQRLEGNSQSVLWPVATPLEQFGTILPVARCAQAVTVVAADGSQIMPSHHEVHSCYLLNIGLAVLTYGHKFPPLLDTMPRLYHRPEDLYPLVDRRRLHIDELYVSLERNLLELQSVRDAAIKATERNLPVVALVDGTLIPWSVEKMADSYQHDYILRIGRILQELKDAHIPLFGYLSHSRSTDLVNMLRVWVCPYDVADCRQMCGHLAEEDFPCSKIWPLSDRQLLAPHLPKLHRGPIFMSGARMARCFSADQRICFSYLNVGQEIARLEFPRWVADDAPAMQLALDTLIGQAEKGMGYPVALSEAHHLAVIRGADRTRFFDLLTSHLVRLGAGRVDVSPKEARKRKGIV